MKERLDRAFATRAWLHCFPLCKLPVFHASASDHDPILLDLFSVNLSRKQFKFHFENTWLQEPKFHKETIEYWLSLPPCHILPNLISMSRFMAKWGRNFFHKFRDKIKKQKELLSSLVNRVDSAGVKSYFEEKESLNELLLHEEVYWKQRAKVFWLTEGDANTKFFHASASIRRKINHINFIELDNGIKVDDLDGMCNVVKDYFTEVFRGNQHVTKTYSIIENVQRRNNT